MPVQAAAGAIVSHGGARISVGGGFLHVPQRHSGIQRRSDKGMPQGMRPDQLGDPGAARDPLGGVSKPGGGARRSLVTTRRSGREARLARTAAGPLVADNYTVEEQLAPPYAPRFAAMPASARPSCPTTSARPTNAVATIPTPRDSKASSHRRVSAAPRGHDCIRSQTTTSSTSGSPATSPSARLGWASR